jgi:hypothetical protein
VQLAPPLEHIVAQGIGAGRAFACRKMAVQDRLSREAAVPAQRGQAGQPHAGKDAPEFRLGYKLGSLRGDARRVPCVVPTRTPDAARGFHAEQHVPRQQFRRGRALVDAGIVARHAAAPDGHHSEPVLGGFRV